MGTARPHGRREPHAHPHALLAIAVTAAALAAATVTPAPAAPAAPAAGAGAVPPSGTYYVQSAVTGLNAADASGTVEQHRPRGNEDRQQWTLRPDGDGHLLENTDSPGVCLGRAGDQARTVSCTAAEARWQITSLGADRYALAAPGTDRRLAVAPKPAGAVHPAPLSVASGAGDLAAWYLTPAEAPGGPLPPREQRTLDQVTFLTAHNAYANGVDGGFAPPFVDLFPNQNRGIQQQLDEGVRGFMLDIHQTPDGAILCHNSCTLVRRPVALWVDLQRIVDFLRAHPDEFVTVFLEDYVDPGVLRAELDRVQGLADVLYRPDRTGVRENGWPTMGELARKRTPVADLHRPQPGRGPLGRTDAGHLRRDVPAGVDRREPLVHGTGRRLLRLVLLQPLVRREHHDPADPHRTRLPAPLRHEPLPGRRRRLDRRHRQRQARRPRPPVLPAKPPARSPPTSPSTATTWAAPRPPSTR